MLTLCVIMYVAYAIPSLSCGAYNKGSSLHKCAVIICAVIKAMCAVIKSELYNIKLSSLIIITEFLENILYIAMHDQAF